MFSLRRKVISMLLLAILVGGCSNPPSATTAPLTPASTTIPKATTVPAEPARPTATLIPTATLNPTDTPVPTPTALPAPATGATCLMGTWEVTDMSNYFAGVMSGADNMASIVDQSGQLLYSFAPDGRAAIKAKSFQEQVDVKMQGMTFKVVVAMNGQATSTYTTQDPDKFVFSDANSSGFKLSATVNGQDMFTGTTADELAAAFGVSSDPKYNTTLYQCDGDTLKITPPVTDARPIILKRVTP